MLLEDKTLTLPSFFLQLHYPPYLRPPHIAIHNYIVFFIPCFGTGIVENMGGD